MASGVADLVDSKAEEVDKPIMEDDKLEVFNTDEDKYLLTSKPPEFCRSLLELRPFLKEADGPLPSLLHGSAWLSEICRLKPRLLLDWSNVFSIRPEDEDEDRRLFDVDTRDAVTRDEVSILADYQAQLIKGKTSKIIIIVKH